MTTSPHTEERPPAAEKDPRADSDTSNDNVKDQRETLAHGQIDQHNENNNEPGENDLESSGCKKESNSRVFENNLSDTDKNRRVAEESSDKNEKDAENRNNLTDKSEEKDRPGRSPRARRKISEEKNNDKSWLQPPQFTAITEDKSPMDFDDLLPHVGEFGVYQKILFLMMIPFLWCVAFVYFGQIFFTMTPDLHWCRVDRLSHLPLDVRYVIFHYYF